MAQIADVAAYILWRHGALTAMKLQKLCYYAYGYHLAWEERQLFPERFEAWANGPVAPVLYQLHKGRYNLESCDIPGNLEALDYGERESIDLVLDSLGDVSAHKLSVMTHQEHPWYRARRRDGVVDLERSSEELIDADIAEFFEPLVSSNVEASAFSDAKA